MLQDYCKKSSLNRNFCLPEPSFDDFHEGDFLDDYRYNLHDCLDVLMMIIRVISIMVLMRMIVMTDVWPLLKDDCTKSPFNRNFCLPEPSFDDFHEGDFLRYYLHDCLDHVFCEDHQCDFHDFFQDDHHHYVKAEDCKRSCNFFSPPRNF